jgi:hypothetical protein
MAFRSARPRAMDDRFGLDTRAIGILFQCETGNPKCWLWKNLLTRRLDWFSTLSIAEPVLAVINFSNSVRLNARILASITSGKLGREQVELARHHAARY